MGSLEGGSVLGAGAGGSAGVSSETGRLLSALLVELGDLGGLTDSLEIDANDTALVVVSGSSILRGWGTVLAGGSSVLA